MATRLVTVFGGSGFVGRHIVRELAARGDRLRIAVRDPDSALFLKPMGDVGQITPIRCRVSDDTHVRAACQGADLVINLVGILYEHGRQRFHDVHVEGARRIAQAARDAGATALIHMSALGADLRSEAHYARSKAQGEAEVLEAFPKAVILRPSTVFGPEDGFFNKFAGIASFSPVLPVVGVRYRPGDLRARNFLGDGGPKFQPVYVGDLAQAVARLADDRGAGGVAYEFGGPTIYTMKEIMELVCRHTGRKRLLAPVPFVLANIMASVLGLLPNPILTRDQVRLLRSDNVVSGGAPGFAAVGILPTGPEAILPRYLDRFRVGGRFRPYRA